MDEKPNVFPEVLQRVTAVTFSTDLITETEDNVVTAYRKVFLTVNNEDHYESAIPAFILDKKQVIALYANHRGAFTKVPSTSIDPEPKKA